MSSRILLDVRLSDGGPADVMQLIRDKWPSADVTVVAEAPRTLRELERIEIAAALQSTGGHRAHAATLLGISERNLYRKLRAFRLRS